MSRRHVRTHRDLEAYQLAFGLAMQIFELTRSFPAEERYALTDQIRPSSRSVCANLAEAWRKRRYEAAFVSKLNDAEAEAAETQTWLEFAVKCDYIPRDGARELYQAYDGVVGKRVSMIARPDPWFMLRSGKSDPDAWSISFGTAIWVVQRHDWYRYLVWGTVAPLPLGSLAPRLPCTLALS